jgi:hypothetical protein
LRADIARSPRSAKNEFNLKGARDELTRAAPLPTLTAAAIFEAAAREGRRQDDDDSDDTTV